MVPVNEANKKQVYIEVWRNPNDPKYWIADCVGLSTSMDTGTMPRDWFNRNYWPYWYHFIGKTADVVMCSQDDFSYRECLAISALILEGKGVKRWELNLGVI